MALEAIVALAIVAIVFASAQAMMTQSLRQTARARDLQKGIEALMRIDGCLSRFPRGLEPIGAPSELVQRGFCDAMVPASEPGLPPTLRSVRLSVTGDDTSREMPGRLLILALPTAREVAR